MRPGLLVRVVFLTFPYKTKQKVANERLVAWAAGREPRTVCGGVVRLVVPGR